MFRCFVLVVHCTHSLVSSSCTRVLFEPTTFSHHSRVLLKGMNVVVSSAAGNKIVIVIYLILFNSRLGSKLMMLSATGSYFRVGFGLKVVLTLLSSLDDVFVHNLNSSCPFPRMFGPHPTNINISVVLVLVRPHRNQHGLTYLTPGTHAFI
ncbi:hypothetical protein HD554DRAFT_178059 [Boletus coccyginus]|nr:hypothetical protein HD554DRAFT_178059 [Boletus coccyginus]